jgi:hypothetical protein
MVDNVMSNNLDEVHTAIIAEYRERRKHHDTPADALNCLVGSMVETIVLTYAEGRPVPHTFIVAMGDVALWWSLAKEGKPLPGELL